MKEELLKMADGFLKIAESLRSIAGKEIEDVPQKNPEDSAKQEVTIETVRAVLAEKSAAGKRKEVKDLLLKYDSGKLSGVNPDDYPALLAEAEAL